MQGVVNPDDLGRLKDYPPDHLLELGAKDLASRDFLKEKYAHEVRFGKRFLESASSKNWAKNLRADAIQQFKESHKFKNVLNEAANIYEQTVQDCRQILHGMGQITVEDLVLMDPKLPMNSNT
ncbi:hypothetical protein CDL12_14117 [Handroanthus impetiginosus]|uniref:Uncharacterized protein n=1 Tax=Handroanthus impetiginosus TaxID=429701 RepID=A0A2G9H7I1_9LAMI|nr:hypothetical protein CDL12_14117 [Handroanthus impetiginosus]